MDAKEFEASVPDHVARRLDTFQAGTIGVIDACVNLWPWLGFHDYQVARDVLEEAVVQNYGAGEVYFKKNIDDCFQVALAFSGLISEQVPPHAIGRPIPSTDHPPNLVCTGGQCKALASDHVVIDLFYAEM